jgi:hypothetical protein
MRTRLLLAAVVAGSLAAPASADALTVGIGDQQPSAFSDGRLRALGLRVARLTVPWDAATTEPSAVQSWLDAVAAAGMTPQCTVVAGDVLDSGSYVRWLQRFRAASALQPQLWGLHNYGDTTYGTTSGTDAVLAAVPGKLWIEETGGIVTLRNAAGRSTLASDETRAATAIDRAFAIARARPRVTRMYVYQWRASALDRFDSGLVRPDGSPRPSYTRVVRDSRRWRR